MQSGFKISEYVDQNPNRIPDVSSNFLRLLYKTDHIQEDDNILRKANQLENMAKSLATNEVKRYS